MTSRRYPKAVFPVVSLFIAMLLVSSAALAQAPLVRFEHVVTYSSGGPFAASVAGGDFNRDGYLDLAVSNLYSKVGVLLGNGDGTFRGPVTYGNGGTSITVADVNGDGTPDLVTVGGECCFWFVSVMLGNGDGSFQNPVTYSSGGYEANSVAVADLNGDGKPDVVVANSLEFGQTQLGLVSVLLGNGDGTFEGAVGFSSGGFFASSVAIADVNGDGHADLVVANNCLNDNDCSKGGGVSLLFGKGDGTFQLPISYSSGGLQAESVAVADVNGDGKLDLLVANFESASVSVLLGNGDGTFQQAISYPSGEGFTTSVQVADVNGDAKPDLLVANTTTVSILIGNGDGTFRSPVTYPSRGILEATLSSTLVVADVNADNRPDLIVANYCRPNNCEQGSVGVLLNNTPFCTAPPVVTFAATPTSLWPPNGKMLPVSVSGTITDTGCSVARASYAVTDEYGQVQPTGPVTVGPGGAYTFTVLLQASRLGTDLDGRLYTITVTASNNAGKTGSQAVAVIIPHDQGH